MLSVSNMWNNHMMFPKVVISEDYCWGKEKSHTKWFVPSANKQRVPPPPDNCKKCQSRTMKLLGIIRRGTFSHSKYRASFSNMWHYKILENPLKSRYCVVAFVCIRLSTRGSLVYALPSLENQSHICIINLEQQQRAKPWGRKVHSKQEGYIFGAISACH